MCPECGAGDGYAHHNWCPIHQEYLIEQVERSRSKIETVEATRMARVEVISEIKGWLNARLADSKTANLPSTYLGHGLLEYLESIKNR